MDTPEGFVGPLRSSPRAKQQSKRHTPADKIHGPSTSSRVYSKRPASSSAALESASSKRVGGGAKPSTRAHRVASNTSTALTPEPVDFVYDIHVRSRLRATIDRERAEVRAAALAREAELRAEQKWVADGSNAHKTGHAPRKEAWTSKELPKEQQTTTTTNSSRTSSRSSSAGSRRSAASSSSGKKSRQVPPVAPFLGPYVTEWQHQSAPRFSASRQTLEHQRKTQQLRERERQREAQSVSATIDAFERLWTG